MDKREFFQKQVIDAMLNIADFMIQKSVDGIYAGRANTIRENLRLNIFVFNEAMGRLKAIGFTSGVKQFSKTQLSQREDEELYYQIINHTMHPRIYLDTEEAKETLSKRSKRLKKEREFQRQSFINSLELE